MNSEYKMVVFDMDGVIVDIESSWIYVHKAFNVDNKINYEDYLMGKIDYKEFMKRDIQLWGLCHIDKIKKIFENIPLINGVEYTIQELRKRGYKLALLSAGISLLADKLNKELNFDYVLANILCTDSNGYLTGEGISVVELLLKEFAFKKLIKEARVKPKECVAIGDSSYDIPIFKNVGLSIAFNTKDISVKKAANKLIKIKDLKEILKFL